MTKREAVREFTQYALPQVKAAYEQDGRKDRVARSEAWNNFTDALCKDRQITMHQYESWTHPAVCN
jgi:hypothetical protein